MKKRIDLSGLYYVFCLVGFYALKEVATSYLRLPLKIFLIVFLFLVSIYLLITGIKKSKEAMSFNDTSSHRSYFELFKKLFYLKCYSYEDFLNISSKGYIEHLLKDNSKKCINHAINSFCYDNEITSIITLKLFKEQIQNDPDNYKSDITLFGFAKSQHQLSILPYDLHDDLFSLDEVLIENTTYKENPIDLNYVDNYLRLNKYKFNIELKDGYELSKNDFYIIKGALDANSWKLKDCTATQSEYISFVNEL